MMRKWVIMRFCFLHSNFTFIGQHVFYGAFRNRNKNVICKVKCARRLIEYIDRTCKLAYEISPTTCNIYVDFISIFSEFLC